MNELNSIAELHNMCMQSLSPNAFELWMEVVKQLFLTRKELTGKRLLIYSDGEWAHVTNDKDARDGEAHDLWLATIPDNNETT